jgi:hypothetical protein
MKLTSFILTSYALEMKNTETECPVYTCDTKHTGSINMDEQVFCFKQDLYNPLEVKLKTCGDGLFCHGGLNRCQQDPYFQIVGRNPGSACTQHF